MSKKKLTQRATIKEAYYMKNPHLSGVDKEPDLSNDTDRVNKFLENLYYFVNGNEPSKEERNFKYNGITKSIVTALVLTEGPQGSFVSRIKMRKFDEITEEQTLEFLSLVYQNIILELDKEDSWWIKHMPSQEYLEEYYSYLDLSKDTDYSKIYIDDIKEYLTEKFQNTADDLNIVEYAKNKREDTAKRIKGAIEEFYPTNILGGILFPTEYVEHADTASDPNLDPFDFLRNKEVFSRPELSLLEYDEKKILLDKLFSKLSKDIDEWKKLINNVYYRKVKDPSLFLEDILGELI